MTHHIGEDGILVLQWTTPERPGSLLRTDDVDALEAALSAAASDDVRGVIVTTTAKDFATNDDVTSLLPMLGDAVPVERQRAAIARPQSVLRRLEKLGKPVVAALRGEVFGSGFELALACHRRVAAFDTRFALPGVRAGLVPSAGATQRLPRLIGVAAALPYLIEGKTLPADKALALGLVSELVSDAALLGSARQAVLDRSNESAPWDARGYRPAGDGVHSRAGSQLFSAANAVLRERTFGRLPAPRAILSCVYEGHDAGFDDGLLIELRHCLSVWRDPVAGNLIRTTVQAVGRAAERAKHAGEPPPRTVAVIGGGMMGAGIAQVTAAAGIPVTLIEQDAQRALQAHASITKRLEREVEKRRLKAADAERIAAAIRATHEYAGLGDVELVVEAVFEDRDLKATVTALATEACADTAIFASNTSTLPITGLAQASPRPEQFIGLHFFSPVDRMPLVEVITGERTSAATLARALAYVAALGKTPIVVRDSRGFFTSRVFSTYVMEGMAMLAEGVSPALIENAGRMSGMPMPPLALADEVALTLLHRIRAQTRADLGAAWVAKPGDAVIERMVEEAQRGGRAAGGGFYDYDADKRLWPGLSAMWTPAPQQPTAQHLCDRLLTIQAVETLRCLDEGLLASADDADVGAVLGWGFAPWTGGPVSYARTMSAETFSGLCERLRASEGPRFELPARFRDFVAP